MTSRATVLDDFDVTLLSRIEDAGLNASAPPEQRWLDGWLVRFSPGKAQRSRCLNAVAAGRVSLADKLALCSQLYADKGLPLLFRITPFTQPADLDDQLAGLGFVPHDETRVMVRVGLAPTPGPTAPVGRADRSGEYARLCGPDFAMAVGGLRGSSAAEREAHSERLLHAPALYQGRVIRSAGDAAVLACGQFAQEGDLVGLYDVVTAPKVRRRGLGSQICERMLSESASNGAETSYLQVGADNDDARRIYRRLGFADAYSYHYRRLPA